jgi:hypothetical protein
MFLSLQSHKDKLKIKNMKYVLNLFTPQTWESFKANNSTVSGFRIRQKKMAEKIEVDDIFVCYLVGLSRWCGMLEVKSTMYEDDSPIFTSTNDPFILRFKVKKLVEFNFEQAVPISIPEIWNHLSITKSIKVGSMGWANHAKLRMSLLKLNDDDGAAIKKILLHQEKIRKNYTLDSKDLKTIQQPAVIHTDRGAVFADVPDREEEIQEQSQISIEKNDASLPRESIKNQAKLVEIGVALGMKVWVPPSDKVRVSDLLSNETKQSLLNSLPLNYDTLTLKTIENIDVIWLQGRSIVRAFEVEHTTSIYSGLLRMADLLALQPNIKIKLSIVAPEERREQVRREIIRPVFSIMEAGAMREICSFIPYYALDELLKNKQLKYMNAGVLEDYEDFFDEI